VRKTERNSRSGPYCPDQEGSYLSLSGGKRNASVSFIKQMVRGGGKREIGGEASV